MSVTAIAEFRASTAALEVHRLQRQVRHLRGQLTEARIETQQAKSTATFWQHMYEDASAKVWKPCGYCGSQTREDACARCRDLLALDPNVQASKRRRDR